MRLKAVLGVIFVIVSSLAWPSAASAAMVNACGRASVCIDAYTGKKDYKTRKQLVTDVQVYTTKGDSFLETWGDGFYYSGNGRDRTWSINRWVRSGTYVCGAGTAPGQKRIIACIAIRV